LDEKSLRLLEFPKMIEMAASLAETTRGRRAVEKLAPRAERLVVENLLEETGEGVELLRTMAFPLAGVKMIDEAIARSRVAGSLLPPETLLAVAETLHACQNLKRRFAKLPVALPRLGRKVKLLAGLPELTESIEQAIAPSGEVRDSASPELRRIRIKINTTQKRIREKLDTLLRSREGVIAAQEQYVTVRDGRFVVPVRSERRSAVPGVIHDQSSSGATVFIEPKETVELNNQVRQLQIAEQREIERILRELTSHVGASADDIARDMELLSEIDCILARARFANLLDAKMPQIGDDQRLVLRGARHPLLILANTDFMAKTARQPDGQDSDREKLSSTELWRRFASRGSGDSGRESLEQQPVIPIDITVGGDYRTLVITGPNTGGKTVALKTAGLLTLLALSGFHIPAQEGSTVPLYDAVFADIGDEQAIEQSLSTFSSHMGQIVRIVKDLTPRSLVLLDEMGAGTDPSEGSALAVAVLRYMTESGAHTIATTHHNSIKVFAHSTPGVKNASVQFDPLTLQPTYRLVIGLPGPSNAFEIAKRLGLPEDLVRSARSSLSVESRRVSELLAFLDKEKSAVQAQSAELDRKASETSALQAELEKSLKFAKERSQQIVDSARREADELIKKAKAEVRSIMASLRARGSAGTLSARDVDRARTRIERLQKDVSAKSGRKSGPKAPPAKALTVETIRKGMQVEMVGIDVVGEVTNIFESKKEAEVSFGGIKVRSKIQSLIPASGSGKRPKDVNAVPPAFATGSKRPSAELMLIGMKRDDAIEALERYLDQANLWGLKEVRIVHGHGKGVLRAAVAEVLRENKLVKSAGPAPPHQGGAGATVVIFKD